MADGSRLRKALNYVTNQRKRLTRFFNDGHVAIRNNDSERELRWLVVSRANWLFVGSDETAPCTFVSLIASAQLHGLNPQAYLRDLFRGHSPRDHSRTAQRPRPPSADRHEAARRRAAWGLALPIKVGHHGGGASKR